MDLTARFKAMQLHRRPDIADLEDGIFTFQETAKIQTLDREILFGCAFNQYADRDDEQLVAVCGADGVHVYKVPFDVNRILHVWGCNFNQFSGKGVDTVESLYTVVWCYDTFDGENDRNPYKLVTGGAGGHIYVIDFETKNIENTLQGFGGDIHDIRVCPTNSNLIATASADESIRIHHIRNEGALMTFGGPRAHAGSILSVDWHSSGDYIVSCGFDHQILKWDLSTNPSKAWLDRASTELAEGKRNLYFQDARHIDRSAPLGKKRLGVETDEEVIREEAASHYNVKGHKYLERYTPSAICSDLHHDYVDCVRMLPDSDLFASKASGNDPHIYISRFGLPKTIQQFRDRVPYLEPEQTQTNYQWMINPSGDSWFTKFVLDPHRRWIACGGCMGEVFWYDMKNEDEINQHYKFHETRPSANTVRSLDFSPCGRLLVGCTDEGTIFRVDRIASDVDLTKLDAFRAAYKYP